MEYQFLSNLSKQIGLLNDYCDHYDNGKHGHALSIAARISVILDMLVTPSGRDFVQSSDLRILSTAQQKTETAKQHGYHPLAPCSVSMTIGGGAASAMFTPAHLHATSTYSKTMKIGAWRNEVVLANKQGVGISRGKLITQMRNKDGGAHAHSAPEPDYSSVSNKLGLGLYAVGPAGIIEFDPPAHVATMRQIAHEITTSITPVLVNLEVAPQ